MNLFASTVLKIGGNSMADVTDKLIAIVIFLALFVALVPTVLVFIGNLSTSGIVLATTVSTIAGILLGIYALKSVMKLLKS